MMVSTSKEQTAFWRLPIATLFEQIDSGLSGLSAAEAAARLARFGPNKVRAEKKVSLFLQYLARFRNPLVVLLLVASIILAFTGDAASFAIISAVILMSVTLDFVQEHRAGKVRSG
jgi:Mg2+-importing ATPase